MEHAVIRAAIEDFRKPLKLSQVEVVPGGSHAYVALQYPQEFSQVIQGFYRGIGNTL